MVYGRHNGSSIRSNNDKNFETTIADRYLRQKDDTDLKRKTVKIRIGKRT